jgi:DNA gyrase inhibitor GyrI
VGENKAQGMGLQHMEVREMEVRVVRLEPLHVASALGFGPNPEQLSNEILRAWIRANSVEVDPERHRIFGFNNPSPSVGSPNYGYEVWLTVGPDAQPGQGVAIKDFSGGLYAVARCKLHNITEAWHELAGWCERSPYRMGSHQWLELCLTPEFILRPESGADPMAADFDLYLPIAE